MLRLLTARAANTRVFGLGQGGPVKGAFAFAPLTPQRLFSVSYPAFKTNTSTRTRENVHDLETFLLLIGRDSVEYLDTFEGDLQKFLDSDGKTMKKLGIDVAPRRYLLRWKHKFLNDLEPLREHPRGRKRNGGERNAKTVKAKRAALKRIEDREKEHQGEQEVEF